MEFNIVIYTWNIPKGGLAKVMVREYHFFKSQINSVSIITSDPIPNAYVSTFSGTNITTLEADKQEVSTQKKDISHFFPGLEVSMNENVGRSIVRLVSFLKKVRPSVIISHQLLSAYLIFPYCLLFRKPYLIILHDNPFSFIEKSNQEKLFLFARIKSYLAYVLSNLVIWTSRRTLCTTSQIKNDVSGHLKVKKDLLVAEYGIEPFPEVSFANRNLFLTVSKWSRFRNPTAYLEILRLLPADMVLTFAGQWDSTHELESFKELARTMGLSNKLVVIPRLTELELSELYDRTRLFMRLGFNEKGTGQAILEALGHGCPVIISRGLGAADLIRDGKEGYLVDESNLEIVAKKLSEVFADDSLCRQLSDSAYKLAKRWEWNDYLKTINKAISVPRR